MAQRSMATARVPLPARRWGSHPMLVLWSWLILLARLLEAEGGKIERGELFRGRALWLPAFSTLLQLPLLSPPLPLKGS